jgi:hypothetical protein
METEHIPKVTEFDGSSFGLSGAAKIIESEEELKRIKKALDERLEELGFKRLKDQYLYVETETVAFYETANSIIAHNIYLIDGSIHTKAVEAMTYAAKAKFGERFQSFGTLEFRRESWTQAALLGCYDSGYKPDVKDIADFMKRFNLLKAAGNPVQVHPEILLQIEHNQPTKQAVNAARIDDSLYPPKQHDPSIKDMVNRYRSSKDNTNKPETSLKLN